ncbi:MAG: hypothetical protein ACYC4R_12980 [Anaerolineae bacterium]
MPRAWENHPLRVIYPEFPVETLADIDVHAAVSAFVLTDAEAVILDMVSGGARYPSQVQSMHPALHLSPGQDPVGELATLAHAFGLRALAGVDWSVADDATYAAHPEWFEHDANGHPFRQETGYRTCPCSGFQNAKVALPALHELVSRYRVDGLVIRGVDARTPCRCPACVQAFGEPIPERPTADPAAWRRFRNWQCKAASAQLETYSAVARQAQPEVLVLVELPGGRDADWLCAEGHALPTLLGATRHALLPTPAGANTHRQRWWTTLAIEHARAAAETGQRPVVRIDTAGESAASAPFMDAVTRQAGQALAHGAGIAFTAPAVLSEPADSPAIQAVRGILGFMRGQHAVIDVGESIAQVALVWPEEALADACADDSALRDALHAELLGLTAGLSARHILFDVILQAQGLADLLARREVAVVPAASWISDAKARQLAAFVRAGGRLVLTDGAAATETLRPLPRSIASLLGGTWSTSSRRAKTAVSAARPAPRLLQGIETFAAPSRYRVGAADSAASVWLRATDDPSTSEQGDPLVIACQVGEGMVTFAAMSLGRESLAQGAADYALLLQAMVEHGSLVKPLLTTDAPATVEVTMAHWQQGVVVHMVNGSAQSPLGPLELSLAWDGPAVAHLNAPGRPALPLLCEEGWNRVRIIVPQIETYAQVVVRSA